MTTRTQSRALGKGMSKALTRGKERQATPLILYHNLDDARLSALILQIQNHLTGASLTIAPPAETDLKARNKRLVADKKEMAAKMAAMQQQIDNQRGAVPGATEWVSLEVAAKRLHKSYSTLWRASKEGRLTTKPIGGKSRDYVVCDPSTYQAKGRGKK